MLTCIADFVIFPVLWSILQSVSKGQVNMQWQPITLQGAGLYHIAMGAVLGIAAYGRTQEKLGGANNGGIALPSNAGTAYTPPAAISQPVSSNFSAPAPTQSFGQSTDRSVGAPQSNGFNNNPAPVLTGFGGKPGPVLPPDPEL
jgi:hypothetical protein